jgi:hypothetical protein
MKDDRLCERQRPVVQSLDVIAHDDGQRRGAVLRGLRWLLGFFARRCRQSNGQ